MILADSSVWVDFFNGAASAETACLDELLASQAVCLGDLVLMEVLQGFRHETDYQTARELLTALPVFELGGQERATRAARNFRQLRAKGVTIRKTVDGFIATFCIDHTIPLLHADRDFAPFHRYLGLQDALEIRG
ncbi:MAG: PIN domain nuclease [Gammaproteobacteria bacterium]|nr:PIN domain nuclease [Gammaproteobacteria bacterium]NIT63291.1 PIN domain nuclease [Gammaproteobacteria bacterium]NIV20220.1 PIN domain-containing protein [Gammaproteobacteria bacterium]NIY31871.1 PIN domain-containing protein [Gammaproteobacteria bacterium]